MIIQEVSNNRNIDGMKCLYKLTEQNLTCSLCREAFPCDFCGSLQRSQPTRM